MTRRQREPVVNVRSDVRYFIDAAARIKEILGDEPIPDTAELTYSFSQGYERLDYKSRPEHGGLHFAGAYHPGEGYCEGNGICAWCGRTLISNEEER